MDNVPTTNTQIIENINNKLPSQKLGNIFFIFFVDKIILLVYIVTSLTKRSKKMHDGILSERDIKVSIEAGLITNIQMAMHIYFSNIKNNPNVAVTKNLDTLKRLIANYNDFTKNIDKLPLNKLKSIHNYILVGKLKLSHILTRFPHLSTEITDEKFIELFDFIYETYYIPFISRVVELHIKRRKNKGADIGEQSILIDKSR